MKFRVTDEARWSHEFSAAQPSTLLAGIRRACEDYRDAGGRRKLHLHVWTPTTPGHGTWVNPDPATALTPVVHQLVTLATARRLLSASEHMVEHAANLMGLAGDVSDVVRRGLYGGPRDDDDEDDG